MSRSDRDQKGCPRSGKRCPESAGGGCAYCRTGKYYKKADGHTRRQQGTRQVRRALREQG